MSAVSSQKSRLLVGDFSMSAYLKNIAPMVEADMLDATVLTSTGKEWIPGGNTSKLVCDGLLDVDGASTALLGQLNTWKSATPDPVSYGPSGLGLGSELLMVGALEASLKTGAKRGETVSFGFDAQTDGQTDFGVSLHDLVAETANGDGTSVDGAAASTNGGVAHLHVTALSGFTAVDVVVADSANNSAFSTIGTFTTATGLTSQRLVIAGTIRRYTRYTVTVTGSGSVTFAVGLARR